MKIDFEFIEKWEPKYDEIAADEGEYNALVNRVNEDVKIYKSISLVVFERIINWKSPRAKGKIKLDNYDAYQETFRSIINTKCIDKMSSLIALAGIGAPIASTILHFIFPNIFPIYDFRTVEALYFFDYLDRKTVSPTRYSKFQKAIQRIRDELVRYDLRQIDRALFAFHKINFSHKKEKCASRHPVKKPVSVHNPSSSRVTKPIGSIPDIVKSICERLGAKGKIIERRDIIKETVQYGLNESSVLPADYCDNTRTGKWSQHSFLHSVGRGRYVLRIFKTKGE